MTDQPLFEQPEQQPLGLSSRFQTYQYRVTADSKVSYRKRTLRRFTPCEECAYLQHETSGAFRPKREVRYRRTGPGVCDRCGGGRKHEAHIDLCHGHARLWREQDAKDMTSGH